jgi:DNA topoisomerase-1
MKKGEYILLNIIEKNKKSNAPPPFTTSTLQQTASYKLGFDAKKTLNVAQKLYENGFITYMRTDSTSISKEAIGPIKEIISEKFGEQYFEVHQFINKKGNTQEAHECIRPTKPNYNEIEGTHDEKRLYSMIWKRTIQSQMKPAIYQCLIIEIKIKDKKDVLEPYKLVGTLENLIFEGYLIVDEKKGNLKIEKDNLQKLSWLEINAIEDVAKPPTRYNDASLINKMDPKNLNIGRPSTYASFIDKIIKRSYVEIKDIDGAEINLKKYIVKSSDPKSITINSNIVLIGKEKKKLVPTILGRNITDFLELNFPLLMDYKFTASMEKDLDEIAEGKINKFDIIKKFYDYLNGQIINIKPIDFKNNNTLIIGKTELGIDIILTDGKYGKYLICGDTNLNLKYLIPTNSKITESNIESNKEQIIELVNNKLYNCDNEFEKKEKPKIFKEWSKGKTTYNLKLGQYGYYLEENNSTGKKANWSFNYLIKKIATDNLIDDIDNNINVISDKITIEDIKANIEYLKNLKKNKK